MSEAIHSFFGPGPLVKKLISKKGIDNSRSLCYNDYSKKKRRQKMIKRIKKYLWCKKMGINHPWKASGDKKFLRMY